ncbi:MAG TPA: O-antigen ligase domain-containing protein, partial [Beijerinckiaceae bacterium]|nr:O-antigen ligase domain-containing protein [Beijerinckiaceae bacterium]
YRHLAQMAWPGLFIFFLQAVQIDVDKWRHVYLLLGIVWGLEAARLRWRAARARAG